MSKIEHRTINGIECKWCNTCKQWKPLSEFSKHKLRWDGLQTKCKECEKQRYADHREEKLEYQKQYDTTLEGYARSIRKHNLQNDRKYGRIGKDEDPLPSIEYYMWALQQRDFYDGKYYPFDEMGLDRIYNDKPHTFANVVPCATKNNRRRQKMPFEEFCELMGKQNEELALACE